MEGESQTDEAPARMSSLTSKLQAMIRIRRKYQVFKARRAELAREQSRTAMLHHGSTGPEIFTFETTAAGTAANPCVCRRKKKRKSRVMFPNSGRKYLPVQERNRAKSCLFLLSIIVFLQVYNAIENLDDHLQKYDLEGLEKTLKREVFGQKAAMENIIDLLTDYLSTYVHNKPLVLSLNGPIGVGKSHLGRILARHFRSVTRDQLVLQYFMLHHCPLEEKATMCTQDLASRITEMVNRGESEERIPVFIFDEVEFMHKEILDFLHSCFQANQTNEFLNAVYVLISNIGQGEITKFVLQNSSSSAPFGRQRGSHELVKQLKASLSKYHPVWKEADIVPFSLLEKAHIMDCFLDEMTQEGFYPDSSHIEHLAGEISYYTAGDKEYSMNGCKQVVAKVNLL